MKVYVINAYLPKEIKDKDGNVVVTINNGDNDFNGWLSDFEDTGTNFNIDFFSDRDLSTITEQTKHIPFVFMSKGIVLQTIETLKKQFKDHCLRLKRPMPETDPVYILGHNIAYSLEYIDIPNKVAFRAYNLSQTFKRKMLQQKTS